MMGKVCTSFGMANRRQAAATKTSPILRHNQGAKQSATCKREKVALC